MPPTYSISSESIVSSSSGTSGTSGSSSSTIWGPGALTGKALVAFGNAALRAVETAVIYRRIQVIASDLSQSKDEVSSKSEKIYDDLLELCRRDLYSSSVRLQALSLVMVQIATLRTSNLVKALVKWPSIEISLFLSEVLKCVPLDCLGDSHESRQVMHIKLEKLYISSQSPGNIHKADPFMIFIGQLATSGEIGCEAIAESGLIDKLLSMFLDDSRPVQTSYRLLGSNDSPQLLGMSMLGCVDLHENITITHEASDPEPLRLLKDSRKSRIGSGNHLTIIPFITRTGVTLLTQSGTSERVQVTINDISVSSGHCRFPESKNSTHGDHGTIRTSRDSGETSARTPVSPRRETLRRLKRAFSVGDRQQAGQHISASAKLSLSHSSSVSGPSYSAQPRRSIGRSPRNNHPASSSSAGPSNFGGRRSGNPKERLRRTISDSNLQKSRILHDRGRLSREPSLRIGDGSRPTKRSYSVGDVRMDGRVPNMSSKPNLFPITRSSSRTDVECGSCTDGYDFSSDSSAFSGRRLERRTRRMPQAVSSSPLQVDVVSTPTDSSDSANIDDHLCSSPTSEALASSSGLSRRKTIQRARNKLRHLKRAFSLNDKPQNTSSDDISTLPRILPLGHPAVNDLRDTGGTHTSRGPSPPTPHIDDEILVNSPGQSASTGTFAGRGLRHIRRAFSVGNRQQDQRPAGKTLQRLRRVFSMDDNRANNSEELGESLQSPEPNLLLIQTPTVPSTPTPAHQLPSRDTDDEKLFLASTISQLPTESFIHLPSYNLQPIYDSTPTNGDHDIPPPYRDISEPQTDIDSSLISSLDIADCKYSAPQIVSQQPSSTLPELTSTQPGSPPSYQNLSSEQDSDTTPLMKCIATECLTRSTSPLLMNSSSCNLQPFSVFLQHRGSVKKVRIKDEMSLPLLRELFLEKFPTNFTLERFPAIHVQDPHNGIKYELEDVNDVTEGSLISLDINPFDDMKDYIDSRICALSQDIKNLQTVIHNDCRHLTPAPSSTSSETLVENPDVSSAVEDGQWGPLTYGLSTVVDDIAVSLNPSPQSTPVTPPTPSGSLVRRPAISRKTRYRRPRPLVNETLTLVDNINIPPVASTPRTSGTSSALSGALVRRNAIHRGTRERHRRPLPKIPTSIDTVTVP